MGRNKTQRQSDECVLRQSQRLKYKRELEKLHQDNNYYNNVLQKENIPESLLNHKEIVDMRAHNINYLRFLNTKIKHIDKL